MSIQKTRPPWRKPRNPSPYRERYRSPSPPSTPPNPITQDPKNPIHQPNKPTSSLSSWDLLPEVADIWRHQLEDLEEKTILQLTNPHLYNQLYADPDYDSDLGDYSHWPPEWEPGEDSW